MRIVTTEENDDGIKTGEIGTVQKAPAVIDHQPMKRRRSLKLGEARHAIGILET